jgi:hypothetical protein
LDPGVSDYPGEHRMNLSQNKKKTSQRKKKNINLNILERKKTLLNA